MKTNSKLYIESNDYTILPLKNFSYNSVKRHAANILIHKGCMEDDFVKVTREITGKLKILDSQVICLFLYLSLDDLKFKNWICQTQWISKNFPPNFSFVTLEGIKIDDETVINFQTQYKELKAIFR